MFRPYNPNPRGGVVGDCVIRAISQAMDRPWEDIYLALCMAGYRMCDLPNANRVWGRFLLDNGFERKWLPDECPDCYTVWQFASDHPTGTYVLALDGHVVCVKDGDWYDSWDSRDRIPLYYFDKKEAS